MKNCNARTNDAISWEILPEMKIALKSRSRIRWEITIRGTLCDKQWNDSKLFSNEIMRKLHRALLCEEIFSRETATERREDQGNIVTELIKQWKECEYFCFSRKIEILQIPRDFSQRRFIVRWKCEVKRQSTAYQRVLDKRSPAIATRGYL